MKTTKCNGLIAALVLTGMTTVAGAQQPQPQPQPQPQQPQQPPVAGKQTLGVTVEEMSLVAKGWSAKKQFIGKPVYNAKNEKIGSIEDVIIAPDKTASFAIIGTGGFVGLDRHDVAIPFAQLDATGNRVVLPNATKEAIKALPPFEYAK